MSAAARVLAVPELLDNILEHAPTQDLLLQQRVNKLWQVTIQESTIMQEKLFFKPKKISLIRHEENKFLGSRIEWNPLLSSICGPPYDNTGSIHYCRFNSKHLDLDSMITPSWKDMLVSDPPSSIMYLGVYGNLNWFGRISTPSCKTAVKMAQIVDALKATTYEGSLRSAEYEAFCQIEVRQCDVEDFTAAER